MLVSYRRIPRVVTFHGILFCFVMGAIISSNFSSTISLSQLSSRSVLWLLGCHTTRSGKKSRDSFCGVPGWGLSSSATINMWQFACQHSSLQQAPFNHSSCIFNILVYSKINVLIMCLVHLYVCISPFSCSRVDVNSTVQYSRIETFRYCILCRVLRHLASHCTTY